MLGVRVLGLTIVTPASFLGHTHPPFFICVLTFTGLCAFSRPIQARHRRGGRRPLVLGRLLGRRLLGRRLRCLRRLKILMSRTRILFSPVAVGCFLPLQQGDGRLVAVFLCEVKRGRAGARVENAVVRRHDDAWVGTGREKQCDALAVVPEGGAHEGGHISTL